MGILKGYSKLIAQEEAVPADKRELVIHTGKLREKIPIIRGNAKIKI